MFMALVTSLVVLFYCCGTADILIKLLQMLLVFYCCGYTWAISQVSVYRTIGPTLVQSWGHKYKGFRSLMLHTKFHQNQLSASWKEDF